MKGMKILYGIQGTGNGHITRSREVLRFLKERGAEVDILLSESHSEIDIGAEVKFRPRGLGFVFGKKGGIDLLSSVRRMRPHNFFSNVKKLPVEDYDIVVSDFEPVTSWACFLKGKKCVSLSHQTSFASDKTPRPAKVDRMGEAILCWYAPVSIPLGLHFQKYDSFIETPVVRREVRERERTNAGHYTVYLPSFAPEKIEPFLRKVDVEWHLFSKHRSALDGRRGNVSVFPVNSGGFEKSLCSSEGVLCNSGFETPSEALFLGKKLLVIPMKGQYEQKCNAAALKQMGVRAAKVGDGFEGEIERFVNSPMPRGIEYPDNGGDIADRIFEAADGGGTLRTAL
ncbi:MAG: glycosyl transferase [Candidatus Dadabacteria bacterium]|nr:glycosyl transferase [Candidatus Dadabacteria bacterium]